MISRFIACTLLVVVVFFSPFVSLAGPLQHVVRLYHDDKFQEEQQKFIPSDTIYVVVDFVELDKQEYSLAIEWVRPDGVLVRNDTHVFTPESDFSSPKVYFWLELHEKGPLSQMMSGREYSEHVYGKWKVRLYCNGELLSTTEFDVVDTIM